MSYDIHIIKQAVDKPVKDKVMSILTVVNKNNEGSYELVNEYGTVIARLDEHTKTLLVKDGVPEMVVYRV